MYAMLSYIYVLRDAFEKNENFGILYDVSAAEDKDR